MEALDYNVREITVLFRDYVDRTQETERHTHAANIEVAAFDAWASKKFPGDINLQSVLFDMMMSCAVEYEESGFIAGFQTAVMLLRELPAEIPDRTQIPTQEQENTLLEAIVKPQPEENGSFISTKEIAKMFDTTNWKVMKRIEDYILPNCSEQEKVGFVKCVEKNEQKRNISIYKLDHQACKLYIQCMTPSIKFFNVAAGIGKLQEMINAVFYKGTAASV